MHIVDGGGKKSQDKFKQQRNGLLAKIHIAKKELGIDDDTYREMLKGKPWCVKSAGDLTFQGLEALVRHFNALGWEKRPGARDRGSETGNKESQAEALRERVMEVAAQMKHGEKRANGLCKTICRVERLEWCRDVGKLKRMLVIMEKIRAEEKGESI